jgi:tetratricopeptide (TPR) repeat protein
MIDPKPLWTFDDPAASEARFRTEAERAASDEERAAWLTQVARALGLQERFAEGHAVLDEIAGGEAGRGDEPAVRLELERGRLLRSGGDPEASRPHFAAAASRARTAGLEELHLDAHHMLAIIAPPEDQVRAHEEALGAARAASDPAARNWDASLLNNLGMTYADAGDFTTALARFQEALAARERIGVDARTREAKWMIAWALRNLGRTEEALAMQRALKIELDAAGASDQYVAEELAILEGRAT